MRGTPPQQAHPDDANPQATQLPARPSPGTGLSNWRPHARPLSDLLVMAAHTTPDDTYHGRPRAHHDASPPRLH
ncbi:hypothetical protein, partial [Nocardia noduli]|uniref:hypothetical protein n=1 Tax=Nocardia noduli TaxID=2815722 RepID=UPI001C235028